MIICASIRTANSGRLNETYGCVSTCGGGKYRDKLYREPSGQTVYSYTNGVGGTSHGKLGEESRDTFFEGEWFHTRNLIDPVVDNPPRPIRPNPNFMYHIPSGQPRRATPKHVPKGFSRSKIR